jgi:hypothetical protein
MNLEVFVEESLSQILSGIRAAQRRSGAVDDEMNREPKGNIAFGCNSGLFTTVDFDVSAVAEKKAGERNKCQ